VYQSCSERIEDVPFAAAVFYFDVVYQLFACLTNVRRTILFSMMIFVFHKKKEREQEQKGAKRSKK